MMGFAEHVLSYFSLNQTIDPFSWLVSLFEILSAKTAPLLHSITRYLSPPSAQRLSGPRPTSCSGR